MMDVGNAWRGPGIVHPGHFRLSGRHESFVVHRVVVGLDPVGAHDARTQTHLVHVAIQTTPFLRRGG